MKKSKLLSAGDVIKTHPEHSFWGCAIVLSERNKTQEFNSMCHIGITLFIFRHSYQFSEVKESELSILEYEQEIRIAPHTYESNKKVTCIGIYTRKTPDFIEVIGQVGIQNIIPENLTFEVGDGSDNKYPLCGPLPPSFGSIAVGQWRSINDREQWLIDRDKTRAKTEKSLEELKGS